MLLITLVALGVGWRPAPVVLAIPAAVVLAALVAWSVLGIRATGQMARERAAGYATAADLAGLEFRDARTGALLRARDVAPTPRADDPRPLVARLFQVTPGSILDRTGRPGRGSASDD